MPGGKDSFERRVPEIDDIGKNRSGWNAKSDEYQSLHAEQLDEQALAWGVWAVPERELGVLGELRGKDILEFGCGGAQWSIFLAAAGARPVGMDLSERQLSHARDRVQRSGARVALVHASAEKTPFAGESFDIVFCDHGAMSFADPRRAVPEAARVLRPGGLFAFNMSSPLRDLCAYDAQERVTDRLGQNYFEMHRLESPDETCFQLSYGEWVRLFRRCHFLIEDLVEIRPPPDATTTYGDFTPLEWARRWPAENIWKLRKE
jgi:ubiquinone/menaquinone biosynthesis C-methylase UbiE